MNKDNLIFYENRKLIGKASILGVPLDLGKDAEGTMFGPDYIRKCGLKKMFEASGLLATDLGNIECVERKNAVMGEKNLKYLGEIVRVLEKTAETVSNEVASKSKAVVLGGDHTIAIGTISGASVACKGDLGVIWIDAHGDMMTHENTLSGNIHGMPSAVVRGLGHSKLVDVLQPGAKIKKENIVYIGLKDLDQAEIDLIRKDKLHAFTIMDLMRSGFEPVFQAIIDLQKRVGNVWISIDMDSIDSMYAPATCLASPDGLTRREVVSLAKFIGKNCQVVGLDVVEIAPEFDVEEKTGRLAVELISYFLGADYGWYAQYMDKEIEKQQERS